MPIIADLHNHSCLSPCASPEMLPGRLAMLAARRGIRLLALTDHNSSLNSLAFARACRKAGVLPVFGLEANTREEVHVLCLFGALEAAQAFSELVYSKLPPFPNDPEFQGYQTRVDENDEIIAEEPLYLGTCLDLGLAEIGPLTVDYGGLVIPAHVDRSMFSMASQFGFVVRGPWSALECLKIPPSFETLDYPLTTSSDAHSPQQIGQRAFELDTSFEELAPDGPLAEIDIKALALALSRRPSLANKI